jgi:hypothetical protein
MVFLRVNLYRPILKPDFHWDNYFSKVLNSKKKKLTDIGFIGFSRIRGIFIFQWIWITMINVC